MKNPLNGWKEHEGFWAFTLVVSLIFVLTIFSAFVGDSNTDMLTQAKIRIIDGAVTGFMALAGAGAQSIWRSSQADKDLASAAKTNAEKKPPLTGEAKENKDEVSQDSA